MGDIMEHIILNDQKNKEPKKLITVFVWIAVICSLVSGIWEANLVLSANLPHMDDIDYSIYIWRSTILGLLTTVGPCVIFAVIAIKRYNKLKTNTVMSIVFGSLAFFSFLCFAGGNIYISSIKFIEFIVFAVSWCGTLIRFKRKIFLIVVTCISFLTLFYECLIRYFGSAYLVGNLIGIIIIVSYLSLLISLILFILYNVDKKDKKDKVGTKNITPEQALMNLKNNLELGMITEEEYQKQRGEIIKKL